MTHPPRNGTRPGVAGMTSWARKTVTLLLVLGLGACAAKPIAPQAPDASKGFDEQLAVSLMQQAQTAEKAGQYVKAADLYRNTLTAWPISEAAWAGLARVDGIIGQGDEQQLALFLGSRVVDYDNMHPRQARMAIITAAENPPANPPGLQPWAQKLVSFFEYKDGVIQHSEYASRERTTWRYYVLFPIAIGTGGAILYSIARTINKD